MTISTNRASYQQLSHLAFGPKKNTGKKAANSREQNILSKVVSHVNKAKTATTDTKFVYEMTEAHKLLRNLIRENL